MGKNMATWRETLPEGTECCPFCNSIPIYSHEEVWMGRTVTHNRSIGCENCQDYLTTSSDEFDLVGEWNRSVSAYRHFRNYEYRYHVYPSFIPKPNDIDMECSEWRVIVCGCLYQCRSCGEYSQRDSFYCPTCGKLMNGSSLKDITKFN